MNFRIRRYRPGHILVLMDNGTSLTAIWHDMAYCQTPESKRPSSSAKDYVKTRYVRKDALNYLIRTIRSKVNVEVRCKDANGHVIVEQFDGDDGYGIMAGVTILGLLNIMLKLGRM